MREYKLVKEYPGSTKLGTTKEFEKCCSSDRCNSIKSTDHPFTKIDIVKYPFHGG